MIYQPSLFAHISSRYHAFKEEVLKDNHCKTAQFWARYMFIIQMVLALIRATRKTTLNCMSALSVCLFPNVHCTQSLLISRVAQSVTCLATDACLTADPGVASSIPARYHTFVEIDHEIISTVILLPSADLFKKGCCQLQAKVCAQITG